MEEGIRHGWIGDDVSAEDLQEFLRDRGRRFYKLGQQGKGGDERRIVLEMKGETIQSSLRSKASGCEVGCFRATEPVLSLSWT